MILHCTVEGKRDVLRIAICDDEEKQLNQTTSMLEDYLSSRLDISGQVEGFLSGEALLKRVKEHGSFDLYILDIIMPGLSGIDAGILLRDIGEDGEIVYLTTSNDFAADSYDVRAFFYLLKPVKREKLFQVLDKALENLSRRRSEGIFVRTAGGSCRILFDRIRYVERIGRYIRYYCTDGTVDSQSIRTSFKEATAPLLADPRFCLCGVSFVLNFQHITGVRGKTALLDNGQTVTLPRTTATTFKKAWGNYWLTETNESR